MPAPKLKNLTILILLLANLMLAIVVFPNRAGIRQEEDALRQSLCDLYTAQEITLLPETVPDTTPLYVLELKENPDSDLQAAAALLGQQLLVEDDSTRYVSSYRSAIGQCSISRSGDFSAAFSEPMTVRDIHRASRKLLKDMGFSHLPLAEAHPMQENVCTVTAIQTILDMPVFSNGLTLTWSDDSLISINGIFFTGTDTLARVSDSACISAADALVSFLDARYGLGWVGSEIVALRQGYVRSETAAATTVRLTPVWQLETDTGTFHIHGMTGDVTPVT